jgi:hypothetical protein
VIYFVDTSALIKIYHPEAGFETMRFLYFGTDEIWISELTRVEFASALRKKFLSGEIGSEGHRVTYERFKGDVASRVKSLSLTSPVLKSAEGMPGPDGVREPFRSLDAIQFSAFKLLCPPESIFVCSDKRLTLIASNEGRITMDPAADAT